MNSSYNNNCKNNIDKLYLAFINNTVQECAFHFEDCTSICGLRLVKLR